MGAYQWCTLTFVGAIALFSAESVAMNFVGGQQEHWCYVEELKTFSFSQQKNIAIPTDHRGSYDACHMFALNYSEYNERDFVLWNRSVFDAADTAIVPCPNGWVYDQSVYVNTITSQLNLVCGKEGLVPLVSTSFMAGTLIGTLSSGLASDRFGRKRTLQVSMALKAMASISNSFPINYTWVALTRFLMGVANTSLYMTSFVYLMEICPPSKRGPFGLTIAVDYSFGFMLWPILAFLIRNDVFLQLTGSLPLITLLLPCFLIEESPRWLHLKGKNARMKKTLRKIAAINGSVLPSDIDNESSVSTLINKHEEESRTCNIAELFRSRTMRFRIITLCMHWFSDSLMYSALSLNTDQLYGDIYINTFIMGVVEIPANCLAIFLVNWKSTGRKLTCSLSLAISGVVSLVSISTIISGDGTATTVFSMVAKSSVTLGFNSIFVYTSELLPTEVRSIGIGITSSASRAAAMVAPFFGSTLADIWPPLPSLICGSFAVISGLSCLLLPETLGRKLTKTIREADDARADKTGRLLSRLNEDENNSISLSSVKNQTYETFS